MASLVSLFIGAYNPAYDRKQIKDLTIVDGKNFVPTLKGYKPSFGSSILSLNRLGPEYVKSAQLVKALSIMFMCNNYGIMRYDEDSQTWHFVLRLGQRIDNLLPWSLAIVGGDIYFCRLGAGVWRYRIADNCSEKLTENVPSNPCSICSADGRLVILGDSTYAWSAVGDGTNLETSLTTGAGFQSLNIAGAGSPIAVKSLNDGFLVFLSTGIVRVETINAVLVFHHRLLCNASFKPVSANSICEVESGQLIWFSANGIYASNGEYPEPFEPAFSKWLVDSLFRYPLNSKFDVPVRIVYSELMHYIFISYSNAENYDNPFTTAFIYAVDLGKWGRLDRNHMFVGDIELSGPNYQGTRLAIGQPDGEIRIVNKDYGDDFFNNYWLQNNFVASTVAPIISSDHSSTEVSSAMTMKSYDFTRLPSILGFYEYISRSSSSSSINPELPSYINTQLLQKGIDMELAPNRSIDMELVSNVVVDMGIGLSHSDFGSAMAMEARKQIIVANRVVAELGMLESNIELAPYHISEFDDINKSTIVTGLSVIGDSEVSEDNIINMNDLIGSVNMNIVPESYVFMGYGVFSKPEYKLILTSSTDSYGTRNCHSYELKPYSKVGNNYRYNSYSTGLYHSFSVSINGIGEYYHIKQIQANVSEGGLVYGA